MYMWYRSTIFIYSSAVVTRASYAPIFISDDLSIFSNYRPISILPCLCKVFEKLFYLRLSGFLTNFNILNHHQYACRPNHFTAMAILELVNNIYEGFENNQYTVGVFMDLKKAFDTVNHEVRLYNLNFHGIRGIPLICVSWFMTIPLYIKRSYVGFPKVHLLDLFLLYINDLFHYSNLLSVILFADE